MATIDVAMESSVQEVKTVADNIYAKVDTEVASAVTNTATNNTANKTGTLSQKLSYIINTGTPVTSLSGKIVKSVQRGVISMTGETATATITSVNTSKAVVIHGGSANTASSSPNNYAVLWDARLALTNSTTVTATRAYTQGSSSYVNYQVIEFY